MTDQPLLERILTVTDQLDLPCAVGLFTASPAPATYVVLTPLADVFDVFADNTPGIEVEEVRLSVFTKTNYLPIRDQLTKALIAAGLVVTARRYVGFEADTGFHHYSIDIAHHRPF